MESGQVVEFIDNQKISCAVVLEAKNVRVKLLSENNREVKLSAERLTHRSERRLPAGMRRDKMTATLKEIAARRRELSREVDIQSLWEVLHNEQQWIDLPTMTVLCFPENPNSDHESAVIRAFFSDRLFFKFKPDQFFPNSADKVEQIRAARRKAEREACIIDEGGAWIHRVLRRQDCTPPRESDEIIRILASFYVHDKDSPDRDIARAILKKAGKSSPAVIFNFLVNIGIWQPDQNLDLLRNEIRIDMPEKIVAHAAGICRNPPVANGRRDLRDLHVMTIDGPATLDFDDALSLVSRGDQLLLGIHITDVGHYIAKGDPIDREALARGSSIYMPDQRIPMLPLSLAQGICSLRVDEDRPAISTLVTLSPEARVVDFEIVPTLIRVKRQLTYQDVDDMIDRDSTLQTLHRIAEGYRNSRLDNGALIIDLPEINIWLDAQGKPMVARIDRESPSHLLVAELMILANSLTARFLSQRDLPAIFRAQAEPRERLFERNQGSLFQNWMQRRQINRFFLNSAAELHAGLGLPAYVTGTSPIRKYSDLITQRQLRAALGLEAPYDRGQIDFLIAALAEPMGTVGRMQFRRNRYWLLKYLEGRIGSKHEAIVLHKRRDGYAILIPEYLIECQLSGAENVALKPEDLIQVTLQHVNARNDAITVYLG